MNTPKEFLYDAFISYSSNDAIRAERLAQRLKRAGLRVWFDKWIIKPGDDIYLAIERGLEAARVQLLCLSMAALSSDWVRLERSTVIFRDPTNAGRRFVPILFTDCHIPETIRRYSYIDYRRDANDAVDQIISSCREIRSGEITRKTNAKSPRIDKRKALERC